MKFKLKSFDFEKMIFEVDVITDAPTPDIAPPVRAARKPRPPKVIDESKELNRMIWNAYNDSYLERYRKEPVRNGMVNGQIMRLAQRLGAAAVDVVKFYLHHDDSFYVKNCHALGLCLKDAESLHTQLQNGVAITARRVREFEKRQAVNDVLDQIDKQGV